MIVLDAAIVRASVFALVRLMALLTAVLVSSYVAKAAAGVLALILRFQFPCASSVPVAPVATVVRSKQKLKGMLVEAVPLTAALVIATGVILPSVTASVMVGVVVPGLV